MAYPTSIKSFTFKRNNIDKVIAEDVNTAYTEITEIERQLGGFTTGAGGIGVTTSTWGTGTFGTSITNWYSNDGLAARLKNIEAGLYGILVSNTLGNMTIGTINGTTIPSSSTLVTTGATSLPTGITSLPNVTTVNGTTIPASGGAMLTSTSTSSSLTSVGTLTKLTIAGSAGTNPPLKLTSGTLVSSPASGAVEYNGNFFVTNANVSSKPAIVSTPYYVSLSTADYSIGYLASPSPAFAGTSITLDTGLYEFETLILFKKSSSGANNISMTFGILGGATVSLVSFSEELYKRTTSASYVFDAQAFTAISNTPALRYSATSGTLTAKNLTRSEGTDQNGYFCGYYKAKGFFKVVVPGTFWIEASYSGAPSVTAASVAVGSFCKVIPMDSNSSAWA